MSYGESARHRLRRSSRRRKAEDQAGRNVRAGCRPGGRSDRERSQALVGFDLDHAATSIILIYGPPRDVLGGESDAGREYRAKAERECPDSRRANSGLGLAGVTFAGMSIDSGVPGVVSSAAAGSRSDERSARWPPRSPPGRSDRPRARSRRPRLDGHGGESQRNTPTGLTRGCRRMSGARPQRRT